MDLFHPNYLVIQGWNHTTCLYADTLTKQDHILSSFKGIGTMPLGAPYYYYVYIFDHCDTKQSFIVTTYPAL